MMEMFRFTNLFRFLAVGAMATVVLGCATAKRPNVIFIMADDLGYGDLGCYGQKVIQTPNIDRLASQGMRFTDFYAGSTVCAPTRCVLMTGKHTGHAHVRGNKRIPLRPEDVTVAELFKQAGYATGIVGKWGIGEPGTTGIPNKKGFDEWFGYLNQHNAHNYYPPFLWRNEEKVVLDGNANGQRRTYSHDLFAEESLAFVERHQDEPFFLYLAYTIPHANNERGAAEGDGMEVPDYGVYADKDWPNPQKGHAAMISRLDGDVGRLMGRLKSLGLENDTIVMFTSDNGPHKEGGAKPDFFDSNGPLRGTKRDLYEGGIRVPMIVRWPGKVKAGATNDHAWAMWDFLPTMADLVGVDAPPDIDGISMLPTLKGKPQKGHAYLYWEFHEGRFKQAIRMGHWKAVRIANMKNEQQTLELFDLSKDLGEDHDIAKDHPAVLAKIEPLFAQSRTESEDWPLQP
jgi:arylsulfatase A-like enzyme